MNKYTNGVEIINATEKAYNAIYKNQGFEPYVEKKKVEPKKEEKKVEEPKK